MDLRFEWGENKAKTNEKRHCVTFEEVATMFADPLAAIFEDERHSGDELREIAIGHSPAGRLILVSFTVRDEAVRIISARKATRRERRGYERPPI